MAGIAEYLKDEQENRAHALREFIDEQINKITQIVSETEKELTDKDFTKFRLELKEYLLQVV